MHIVQNVCGCIGQLMMGSGLADLIGAAFGGVGSIMAQGIPWVRAMRSFRMVSSVILQSFLQAGFKTWDDICEYLAKARLHHTGRHWVDNLITRISLFTSCCAPKEREIGSFNSSAFDVSSRTFSSLATTTMQDTSHAWHCLEMAILLPAMANDDLLSGSFVCRHKAGSWNAVSADQFGEQTAIKIGKGGLKGITLSPEQVAEWIDSFPISAYVSDALDH